MAATCLSSNPKGGVDTSERPWYNKQVIERRSMRINSEDLVALKHLQEDMAEYFCDENQISGETYWECLATLGEIKLMEIRGEIMLTE